MLRSLLVLPVAAALTAGLLAGTPATARGTTPVATNGAVISTTLRQGVAALPVRAEHRAGYVRSKFTLWSDADHDCQDTRSEVLRQESRTRVTGACTVKTGRWVSQYDGVVTTRASTFDIDHLVPLAEAWDSGARRWSSAKREAYANDLADRRTLIAVSASANRSKGDRDPAEWLPARQRCLYVAQWTIVKTRWGLSVNAAEKRALTAYAASCPNRRITTRTALVGSS